MQFDHMLQYAWYRDLFQEIFTDVDFGWTWEPTEMITQECEEKLDDCELGVGA